MAKAHKCKIARNFDPTAKVCQRICLVAKKGSPAQNLDSEGDAALADRILQLKKRGTTVVIISHRPTTIGVVDKISVRRDGIAEMFEPRNEIMARLTRAVPVSSADS